ncbi:MAG TPA: hypothetical protein VKR61_11160 [Bryobacteraceae bacterium]|nr:hypothetical protein [Bryobacteraceae bacterium]
MADPKSGTGDWNGFGIPLERVFEAAEDWKQKLAGVEKPWLCWNVSQRWSTLQQKLVRHAGWTPVVGCDPRAGLPPLIPQAVAIDFNAAFGFPVMWPLFPLEFAFLFTERLAFWHADLLCRLPVMEELAARFAALADGQMSAVLDKGGLRNSLNFKSHRFWELCGCTTRGASRSQFDNGAGWWRNFAMHPKCGSEEERARRQRYSWDSGVGILYWRDRYHGAVQPIDARLVKEGHCSEIGMRDYRTAANHREATRDLSSELDMNYSLDEVADRLGIGHLLETAP